MPEAEGPARQSVSGKSLPAWTYEQGMDFEVAEWVLGSLIAWTSTQLATGPGEVEEKALRERSAELAAERRRMLTDGPDAVTQVLRKYGPQARDIYGSV